MFGEWQVGKSGVLAGQTPGGLTMARQIKYGKLVLHHFVPCPLELSIDAVRESAEAAGKALDLTSSE
jgi:hypothetical protein